LTSEKQKATDVHFMRIFFYTYPMLATAPLVLKKKLIQRYHVPPRPDIPIEKYRQELLFPIRERVCAVIKFWIDKCGWEWNEKLCAELASFIDGPLSRDGNLKLVKQLRTSLAKHQQKNAKRENYVFAFQSPEAKVQKSIFIQPVTASTLVSIDEIEIARQMTLMDFNLFAQILITELLNSRWNNPLTKHTAPNVTKLLLRFDNLFRWVCESILESDNKKSRAKLIERFIKIADNLRSLKNLESFCAIMKGLNAPYIIRLNETFFELPIPIKEKLTELNSTYTTKITKEALKVLDLPAVPLLSLGLEEFLEVEKQEKNSIDGLINFQKCTLLFNKFNNGIEHFQKTPYNLQPIQQIMDALKDISPAKTIKKLVQLSEKWEIKK